MDPYVVTGAASGIGAATARYLRHGGSRVIGCDLRGADVIADLTTGEGRAGAFPGRPEQAAAVLAWCVSPRIP
jgi:NAD(P)-dependent dehydrogenase (short-subunit alcohol dehydrogenase family)